MKDYRMLEVWKKGHDLTLCVYRATRHFPKEELFGLTAQMRRSSSSIPTNVAEGCGRDGDAELKRFINIALGSACELDYQILLANDLGYFEGKTGTELSLKALSLRRQLGAFVQKLKSKL